MQWNSWGGTSLRLGRMQTLGRRRLRFEPLETRALLSASPSIDASLLADGVLGYGDGAPPPDFTPPGHDEPTISPNFAPVGSKWPQPGGLGSPVTITYSYSNFLDGGLPGGLTEEELYLATEESLALWAAYAPLNFIEVEDSGPEPDDSGYSAAGRPMIRVGHHFIDGNNGANTLAHAYFPGTAGLAGDVHFDNGNNWRVSSGSGVDVIEVMVHELGHALGLGHEDVIPAIMRSFIGSRYDGPGTAFLFQDDINGIRAVYGTGVGSVTPLPRGPSAAADAYVVAEDASLRTDVSVETLIEVGSSWRYLDDGSDQGTAWREPGFNDSRWAAGTAQFGHGDGDEATIVRFGGSVANKHITTYFRTEFTASAIPADRQLRVRLLRDDGAAVYLNGFEIIRDGLPANAGYQALATQSIENAAEREYVEFTIDVDALPRGALVEGVNILAAEVHLDRANSDDLSFDMDLAVKRIDVVPGLLDNDLDPLGEPLIATLDTPPSNGSVRLSANGAFTYTPAPDFFGTDRFRYRASAGGRQSPPTMVTISVEPRLDAPLAATDVYVIDEDVVLTSGKPVETVVPRGALWRYLDDGSNQETAWRERGFDDRSWPAGTAQLGYGDGDEATVVEFGDDPLNKFVTTYFRHHFDVPDAARVDSLLVRLLRDDGAAVYLNGEELVRDNLADDALHDRFAGQTVSGANEDQFFEFTRSIASLPPGTLRGRGNVLAVEVHQADGDSSDVSFDIELDMLRNVSDGVLLNDVDADGAGLTAIVEVAPAHGDVLLGEDGQFVYTPHADFHGEDQFSYRVRAAAAALVVRGAFWKFLDDGSDQGVAWTSTDFVDDDWSRGPAQLGYGDGDEATTVSFGGDSNNKHATTYFRKSIFIEQPSQIVALTAKLLRDDAAAVYLNGVQVHRDANLPVDAGFDIFATSSISDEDAFDTFTIDPGLLREGPNVIAVEVHQSSRTNSDVSFDLELFAAVDSGETAVVEITVAPVNDLPTVVEDRYTALGGPLTVNAATGVLANDFDVDGDGASFTGLLSRAPDHGQVVLAPDGSFLYKPRFGFSGVDEFGYVAAEAPGRVIVPSGDDWRFRDVGSNERTEWRETAFDDSAWSSGPAPLGYGRGGEATVVSFGENDREKFITTYFRGSFSLRSFDGIDQLALNLVSDDGAAVYLNGVEVARTNLAANPVFDQSAIDDVPPGEQRLQSFLVDSSLLVLGANVLAVEIHQSSPLSDDLVFDLELTSISPSSIGTVAIEVGAGLPGDANGDGVVDLADLNAVRNNFGAVGASPGDTNGDGVVDLSDLNAVRNNFGAQAAARPLSLPVASAATQSVPTTVKTTVAPPAAPVARESTRPAPRPETVVASGMSPLTIGDNLASRRTPKTTSSERPVVRHEMRHVHASSTQRTPTLHKTKLEPLARRASRGHVLEFASTRLWDHAMLEHLREHDAIGLRPFSRAPT